MRREMAIKRLTRQEKEAVVGGHAAPAMFESFRPRALAFLRRLKRNNRREWFERNRAVYETEVRDPMRALVEEMLSGGTVGEAAAHCKGASPP